MVKNLFHFKPNLNDTLTIFSSGCDVISCLRCAPFTKNNERCKHFKKTCALLYIYRN